MLLGYSETSGFSFAREARILTVGWHACQDSKSTSGLEEKLAPLTLKNVPIEGSLMLGTPAGDFESPAAHSRARDDSTPEVTPNTMRAVLGGSENFGPLRPLDLLPDGAKKETGLSLKESEASVLTVQQVSNPNLGPQLANHNTR